MVRCKKCNKGFEIQKGLKNYCSLKCRNSRNWNEEDKLKKSIANKDNEKLKLASKIRRDKFLSLPKEIYEKIIKNRNDIWVKNLFNKDFKNLSNNLRRKRIILEQEGKCNRCGLDKWLGENLCLEFEHKDGNRNNNLRENLEALCPNCHSLTSTWRGRNNYVGKGKEKINHQILLNFLIDSNWNMHRSLIKMNVAPKGGNYKLCHRLKREYEEQIDIL